MTITIDEVIQILKNDIELSKMNALFCHNNEYGIGALQIAVKKLEQTRWIPVSEKLPDKDGCYLVSTTGTNNDIIDIAYYTEEIWHKASRIKAWMPLPEPYRGGDTDAK